MNSFVPTPDELDSYYALGVRRFEGARMIGAMFTADDAVTAALLPPPLEQSPMPGGLVFIAEYSDTNLGPGYREAALFLRCSHEGEMGNYCLSMPITDETRMANGRDIFGFPKKMAEIGMRREGSRVTGWAERKGVRFLELDVELEGELPLLPPAGPNFLFKASPRIDLRPGFDGPVLLCRQQTDVELVEGELGRGTLKLTPSATDPWAALGDVDVTMAFAIVSNNTMMPGKVLGEVDADAFLPHYFNMTDFFAGPTLGATND